MILWRSRIDQETEVAPGMARIGLRAWRWVLRIGWASVDLHKEVRFGGGAWRPTAGRYYSVGMTKDFKWGSDHVYYDGPHCSFSIGCLYFAWSPKCRCLKCEPEECC